MYKFVKIRGEKQKKSTLKIKKKIKRVECGINFIDCVKRKYRKRVTLRENFVIIRKFNRQIKKCARN